MEKVIPHTCSVPLQRASSETLTYSDHDSLRDSHFLLCWDPGSDSSEKIQKRCDFLGLSFFAVAVHAEETGGEDITVREEGAGKTPNLLCNEIC